MSALKRLAITAPALLPRSLSHPALEVARCRPAPGHPADGGATAHRRPGRPPRSTVWVAAAIAMTGATVSCQSRDDVADSTSTTSTTKPMPLVETVAGVAFDTRDEITTTFRFVIAANGSFRIDDEDGSLEAFDATNGNRHGRGPGGESAFVTRRVAPSGFSSVEHRLERALGWSVRSLASAHDPGVVATTFEGREAWRYRTTIPPNESAGESQPVELVAVVDRQTSLPLEVTRTSGNAVARFGIREIDVNVPVAITRFALDAPGAQVNDEGWVRFDPAEARERAGTAIVVPATVPEGFASTDAAANQSGLLSGPEASNPDTKPAAMLSYRRGIDVMTITIWPVGDDPRAWVDPYGREGAHMRTEQVTLKSGALRGAHAEVAIDPGAPPHLWARGDRLVVAIDGPLTRTELMEVAGSLA